MQLLNWLNIIFKTRKNFVLFSWKLYVSKSNKLFYNKSILSIDYVCNYVILFLASIKLIDNICITTSYSYYRTYFTFNLNDLNNNNIK